MFHSKRLNLNGVKVFSGADGIDPNAVQDVTIKNVFVNSCDDAIVVKAKKVGCPTINVSVENAVVATRKSAAKIGTESDSDISNVSFTNIEGFEIHRGVTLYLKDGGIARNISWKNIRFSSFGRYKDKMVGDDVSPGGTTGFGAFF